MAGLDGQEGGEMGLADPRRAEKDDVFLPDDEVEVKVIFLDGLGLLESLWGQNQCSMTFVKTFLQR